MNTELKAKLIQFINTKKNFQEGFTLIELLVVIVILGVLAGIALPSFLGQSVKGRQTEAKIYISSLNKNQQGFYFEKGRFASYIDELGLGRSIATATVNYTYATTNGGSGTESYAWSYTSNNVSNSGVLKNYSGRVTLKDFDATSGTVVNTVALLCEEKQAGVASTLPTDADNCNPNQNNVGVQ